MKLQVAFQPEEERKLQALKDKWRKTRGSFAFESFWSEEDATDLQCLRGRFKNKAVCKFTSDDRKQLEALEGKWRKLRDWMGWPSEAHFLPPDSPLSPLTIKAATSCAFGVC